MNGGYGPKGKDTLKSALRSELAEKGQRRLVRVIETRCMGICPKKAVTALNAEDPGTILTIPRKIGCGCGACAADGRLKPYIIKPLTSVTIAAGRGVRDQGKHRRG